MTLKEMTGSVFGALTVLNREPNAKDGTAVWRCVCQCGEIRVITGTGLRAGRHKSCGCQSPRFTSERTTTHGLSKTRVYTIWQGMIERCSERAKGKTRRLYYDKGIRVCDHWQNFENFFQDMGQPEPWQSIDRIDGSKGYEKSNCRWASRKTQANNTSQNLKITLNGITKTASEWADETGIKANTIVYRIRRKWPPERALQKNPMHIGKARALKRMKKCLVCDVQFIPRPAQLRQGHGKYCSQQCNADARNAL
jgi:hypothetical protein